MGGSLVWLRNDLRISDNPALHAALEAGDAVAVFIHETNPAIRPAGGAARWWQHQSLQLLETALAELGVPFVVTEGDSAQLVPALVAKHKCTSVHWNRRYAPGERGVDAAIKEQLDAQGITATSHPGNVLCEPWTIATKQGKPYSVYTPFWRTLRGMTIADPLPEPRPGKPRKPQRVDTGYRQPHWAGKFAQYWEIGEKAAQSRLHEFLDDRLAHYSEGRNILHEFAGSRLSPHLRHGEISPRQAWHAALAVGHAKPVLREEAEKFMSELAWRDFNYHQLFHRDDIATVPMQPRYANLKWRKAEADLRHWQQGQTGIPLVDAGMRELWETGVMHNRVRMVTASFLIKNLLIDWRQGEQWFWDCLVDGDDANNPGNWQWVAGCGLDASPFFRIFNPVTQGEKFDRNGEYIRRWVPELKELDGKWVHQPSASPKETLAKAEVALGKTYPKPIVDLKETRGRALAALAELRE